MSARVLAPLRTRYYRQLWIGQVILVIGDKINQLAMALGISIALIVDTVRHRPRLKPARR